jgi:hypothetical protein
VKRHTLPVFTISFSILYTVVFFLRVHILVYYPTAGRWTLRADTAQPNPPMYYYGWIAIALAGSILVAALSQVFPTRTLERSISSAWTWVVPLIALPSLALIYGSRFNLW